MGKIKKIIDTAKYLSPLLRKVDLNQQLNVAMKLPDINEALEKYEGTGENFRETLKKYISQENYKNRRLKNFAEMLDTTNKALVPVDTGLDAIGFLGGIGFGIKGLIDVFAKLPLYVAYDSYYFGKTHNTYDLMKNIGYETASWFSPGSLPHLINYYTHEADNYSVKKGSERFLKFLGNKTNTIEPKFRNKGKDLEGLALAA